MLIIGHKNQTCNKNQIFGFFYDIIQHRHGGQNVKKHV